MPNWCAGTLRFRGPTENVMKFLNEGFEIYNELEREANSPKYICQMMDRIKKKDLEAGFGVSVDLSDNGEYIYICNTKRAFVEWDPKLGLWRNELEIDYRNDNAVMLVILPVKQAWGVYIR